MNKIGIQLGIQLNKIEICLLFLKNNKKMLKNNIVKDVNLLKLLYKI